MADLLIRGMALPSGCLSCDFCNPFADEPYCRRLMKRCPNVTRLEECPLVELPEHGDLIDRAEFESYVQNQWEQNEISNGDWIQFREWLKDQQTIIPASKEGGE